MDKLSLDIYLLTQDERLEEVLADTVPIELTSWEFHAVSCDEAMAREGRLAPSWNTVIISDDLDLLRPYLSSDPDTDVLRTCKAVLISSNKDSGGELSFVPGNLFEVWPADEPDSLRCQRFHNLVAHIRATFDAWLYKNLLISGIDNLPGLVWFKNKSGLHNLVNNTFCDTVKKAREDVKDREHNYIWDVPDDDPSALTCDDSEIEVMGTREQHVYDEKITTADGMKQLQVYKAPLFGIDGEVMGTTGYGNDVTNFSNMGVELEILVENLPFSLVMCDRDWNAIKIDQSFRHEFGVCDIDPGDFDYLSWRDSLEVDRSALLAHSPNPPFVVQGDDGPRFYALDEHEIRDYFGNVSGYFCVVRDVTLKHNYENRMHRLANTDDLTHVANRRAFYKYLEARSREPLCVFFFDLDNFKRVNDTIGHATGDDVLVKAARTIQECMPDGFVARFGGDEFAVAVPGLTDQNEAELMGQKTRRLFEERVSYLDLGVGISYGYALCGDGQMDVDEVLSRSDIMMYEAKKRHHQHE